MTLDDFLEKLEGVRPGGTGYVACCPAHDDREASLGISEGDGSILVNCYAGCATSDVLAALGLTFSDLFFNAVNYAEPEAVYDYVDEIGDLLFQAVRFPGKKFRQRHLDDETGEWVWSLDGVRRVIYRLPEVLQAIHDGTTVYITEGEKDAEALRAVGRVATCNPMGAGKWRPEYAQFFHGANVVIVADRDEPGRNHAEAVKQSLQGIAKNIWLVQARTGKDAADHLAAGHAVEEFVLMRQRVRRGIVTARELAEQAKEDLELNEADLPGYILVEEIPVKMRPGRFYALGGYTGDGKTRYALQGTRKLCSEGARLTYFSLEMPERDLRNGLIAHRGIPLALLEEPWRLRMNAQMYQAYLDAVEEIGAWNLDIVFDTAMNSEKVSEIVRDREADVAVIDHIHRFGWGAERRKFEEQVTALTNLALEQNVMLLALSQLREPRISGKDIEVYPRPTLQSFRESGVIGQDASMALAVWRQRDAAGLSYTGATQVIVLKNRHTTGPHDAAGSTFFPHFDTTTQMFVRHPGGANGTSA